MLTGSVACFLNLASNFFKSGTRTGSSKAMWVTQKVPSMAFPAISAIAEGYKVFVVVDASGTYSKMAQEITLARVVQAGAVPMDTAAVASEIQKTWHRDDAEKWAEIYTQIFPEYRLLIESYAKAREVEQAGEQLDSTRS